MRSAWRRFRAMPDGQRARILAITSASVIVGMLYGLGGLSLYLRASFIEGTPPILRTPGPPRATPAALLEEPTLFPTITTAAPTPVPTGAGAPTLYPTITPRPGA